MRVRTGQMCAVLGALALVWASCQVQQQQAVQQLEPGAVDAGAATPSDAVPEPLTHPGAGAAVKPETPKPGAKKDTDKDGGKEKPKYKPVKMGSYVPHAPGRRVACVSVPGPYVALTFDDGPSAANTPRILDILKAHNARATFFVVGEYAVNHKNILARAAAEGHEIGAHTYSHINLSKSSDEKIDREMSRTNAIITEATGRAPRIMRPPYGATNARLVDKMYDDYGMSSILWDVDTQDWRHPGVSVVVRRAVTNARPGSIILVHDIHASTADAVEDIVEGLQERGFTLVTVSELLSMAGKGEAPAESKPEPAGEEEPAAPEAATEAPEGAASITGSGSVAD